MKHFLRLFLILSLALNSPVGQTYHAPIPEMDIAVRPKPPKDGSRWDNHSVYIFGIMAIPWGVMLLRHGWMMLVNIGSIASPWIMLAGFIVLVLGISMITRGLKRARKRRQENTPERTPEEKRRDKRRRQRRRAGFLILALLLFLTLGSVAFPSMPLLGLALFDFTAILFGGAVWAGKDEPGILATLALMSVPAAILLGMVGANALIYTSVVTPFLFPVLAAILFLGTIAMIVRAVRVKRRRRREKYGDEDDKIRRKIRRTRIRGTLLFLLGLYGMIASLSLGIVFGAWFFGFGMAIFLDSLLILGLGLFFLIKAVRAERAHRGKKTRREKRRTPPPLLKEEG